MATDGDLKKEAEILPVWTEAVAPHQYACEKPFANPCNDGLACNY